MKLPFWMTLKYYTDPENRKENSIKYYYEGEELKRKLFELRTDKESTEYKILDLEFKLSNNEISKIEFDKQCATIKKESWMEIIEGKYITGPDGKKQLYFEFDWNDYFIHELKQNGYSGVTDDDIVNNWFNDTCQYMAYMDREFGGEF